VIKTMIKFLKYLPALFVFALQMPAEAAVEKDVYIIVLKDDVQNVHGVASEMASKHGIRATRALEHALKGLIAHIPEQALAKVKADVRVKYVEKDVEVFAIARGGRKPRPVCGDRACNGTETCSSCPQDCGQCPPPPPSVVCGDGICNGSETCSICSIDCGACTPPPTDACASEPAQVVPYGTTRVGGGTLTSSRVAWVIDTGIDLDHCDLNVDVARSKSFVSAEPSADDLNGHGTHVAGTIAAKNNAIDTVGVAPGTKVVAVKALDSTGSGALSAIVSAVNYVTAWGISGDVVNMSLGFAGYSQSLNDAIVKSASLGFLYAIASGNSAALATGYSPASTNHNNVKTVSAVDSADRFASFSNYGNPPVDFAAPGVGIVSRHR